MTSSVLNCSFMFQEKISELSSSASSRNFRGRQTPHTQRRTRNSTPNPHVHNTPWTQSRQVLLWANPNQSLTSGQRPLLFGVRRDLIRGTSKECTLPTLWHWHATPLTAPSQRLIYTNPRSAACISSSAQDYHPNVWSNSSSGIGSASTRALCNNRSCPASAVRFAVWSNSSSEIASNTAFGAASSCSLHLQRR